MPSQPVRTAGLIALVAACMALRVSAEPLPPDPSVLNVRDFGATGNGRDDDTAAIQRAIAASGEDMGRTFWEVRIVYIPAGVYLVSDTLMKRYATGKFGSGLMLIGESEARTVIRLKDQAPGFTDAAAPRAVIFTSSKHLDGTPTSGGKDYPRLGEGNDAYMNFVEDMTIDVGSGNPGAVALDYLANNIGAVRNVTMRAAAGSGAVGLSLARKWPGPALIKDVHIQGFAVGMDVAQTEYGLSVEHLRLSGQSVVGLRNRRNSLAMRDVSISGDGPAVINAAPEGLVAIETGNLHRSQPESGPAPTIENIGTMVLRNVVIGGWTPEGLPENASGIMTGSRFEPQPAPAWALSAAKPWAKLELPPGSWVNAAHFGAVPGPDSTDALQAAFNSGAPIVYLPGGTYFVSNSIELPASLRRVVGLNAVIRVWPQRRSSFDRTKGMFRVTTGGMPLTIDRITFDNTDRGPQLAVELTGSRDLILRDIVSAGTALLDRKAGGGRVYLENVCGGRLQIFGDRPVDARQLNTEGGGTRILNRGAPLSILGIKTEGATTVVDNQDGAATDVFGGLIYVVRDTDGSVPAFRNANSKLSATFVEESLRPESRYRFYSQGPAGAVEVGQFPPRGFGRTVPGLRVTE